MREVFIKEIKIAEVRHLKELNIPVSETERKHLILTGKNGSGKTSLLDAVALYLRYNTEKYRKIPKKAEESQKIDYLLDQNVMVEMVRETQRESEMIRRVLCYYQGFLNMANTGIQISFNLPMDEIMAEYEDGQMIFAYYKAERIFQTEIPHHVEKVKLKDCYAMFDVPRQEFVKYLLDLKTTEALALAGGKTEKARKIQNWFAQFQALLRRIFEDDTLELQFDEDTFTFQLAEAGRHPFGFNELSSGYAAVLDIVVDLMMRMEKQNQKSFAFELPGIVLIDEIETHLHLEMQKKVLDFLTAIFPNIQFVVSTHSPFILNSLENAVIYDLERHIFVENGLSNVPYDGIVEGYFQADKMSASLREKFERYKFLVNKKELTDEDFEEIARLEMFLEEIPDYLALDITTEYQKLRLAFEAREDL
ncbi:MAG: AAA family ATPase [Eubacteriales bacterium]|nr:AAA family ATPase [Eubacteriales bacterium]